MADVAVPEAGGAGAIGACAGGATGVPELSPAQDTIQVFVGENEAGRVPLSATNRTSAPVGEARTPTVPVPPAPCAAIVMVPRAIAIPEPLAGATRVFQ